MILGELCNFAGPFKRFSSIPYSQLTVAIAYAFVEAIVVVSSIPPPLSPLAS